MYVSLNKIRNLYGDRVSARIVLTLDVALNGIYIISWVTKLYISKFDCLATIINIQRNFII